MALFVNAADSMLSLRSRCGLAWARAAAKAPPLRAGRRSDFLFLRRFSEQCPDEPGTPLLAASPCAYLRVSEQAGLREALERLGRSPAGRRAASRAVLALSRDSLIRRSALFSRRWALKGEHAQAQAWADLLAQLLSACQVNPADRREGFLPFLLLSFDFSRAPALLACAQAPALDLSARAVGASSCAEIIHSLSHGWLKAQQVELEHGLCAKSADALREWIERSEVALPLPLWRRSALWSVHRSAERALPFWLAEPETGRFARRASSTPARWALGLAAQRVKEGSAPRRIFEALLGRVRSHIDQRALAEAFGPLFAPGQAGAPASLDEAAAPARRPKAKRL